MSYPVVTVIANWYYWIDAGKEGPVYTAEEFKTFCLVAVIGARERCLRDDFHPLYLQNPWKKGRLFVRQKKDVLAAIEQSGRQPHPPAVLWKEPVTFTHASSIT